MAAVVKMNCSKFTKQTLWPKLSWPAAIVTQTLGSERNFVTLEYRVYND